MDLCEPSFMIQMLHKTNADASIILETSRNCPVIRCNSFLSMGKLGDIS